MKNQTENFAVAMPKAFLKWWLRTRNVKGQVPTAGVNLPPCIEIYVPWWAWPIELIHRAIFGRKKLEGRSLNAD